MESSLFSDVVYLFVGVPVTFFFWVGIAFTYTWWQHRKNRVLNQNLALIGKKWAYDKEKIIESESLEDANSQKTFLIMGIILCIFSWLGFLFSFVAAGSIFLVTSRREKFVRGSVVAQVYPQPEPVIQQFIQELATR